eukprot:Gb_36486 [translate_table: standard]
MPPAPEQPRLHCHEQTTFTDLPLRLLPRFTGSRYPARGAISSRNNVLTPCLNRGSPETASTSQPCSNGFLRNFPLPVTFEFPCTSECGTFSCLSGGSSPALSSTLQPSIVSLQDH